MIIYLLHNVYMFLSIEVNIKGSPGGGRGWYVLTSILKRKTVTSLTINMQFKTNKHNMTCWERVDMHGVKYPT